MTLFTVDGRPAHPPAAPRPRTTQPGILAILRALHDNPITVFTETAFELPIVEIGLFRQAFLVNEPGEIEHVLIGNAANYRKGLQQQRRLRPALGDGLLTAEGHEWRRTRRIAAPLFSPRAMAALVEDMSFAAEAMCERWRARPDPDAPVEISAEFQRLTYEIVSRTVFSGALDAERARVHAGMATYFDTVGRTDLASLLNVPPWLPTLAGFRARAAMRDFRAIVDRVVAQRSRRPDSDLGDLLDRLMRGADADGEGLSQQAVADNVLTFLAAGHETTGNALSWLLYLLALHPEAQEGILAELQDVPLTRDGLDRLPFTHATILEALRLYPTAAFLGREAIEADEVAGRRIAPGTQILISPWVVHRHRRLWRDPDVFRPERFMPGQRERIARGAFIPFGLGPRTCIGEHFAVQEILVVLAAILRGFRFRLVDPGTVFPQARITLRPEHGIRMRIIRRDDASG